VRDFPSLDVCTNPSIMSCVDALRIDLILTPVKAGLGWDGSIMHAAQTHREISPIPVS